MNYTNKVKSSDSFQMDFGELKNFQNITECLLTNKKIVVK